MTEKVSKSEAIRKLAKEGHSTSEIARSLGIRYQHAYNVLRNAGELVAANSKRPEAVQASSAQKPTLSTQELLDGGFVQAGNWTLSESGDLQLSHPLPKVAGVYAFAKGETVLYVGVATMGLAKRAYFYSRPGRTQRTSQRLHELIRNELRESHEIAVYVATPPDLEWNGLPVHGSAGLELGLIKKYALPWNVRSV